MSKRIRKRHRTVTYTGTPRARPVGKRLLPDGGRASSNAPSDKPQSRAHAHGPVTSSGAASASGRTAALQSRAACRQVCSHWDLPVGLAADVIELLDSLVDRPLTLQRQVAIVEGEGGLRVLNRVVLVLQPVGHRVAEQVPREEAEGDLARAGDPK